VGLERPRVGVAESCRQCRSQVLQLGAGHAIDPYKVRMPERGAVSQMGVRQQEADGLPAACGTKCLDRGRDADFVPRRHSS